MFRRVHLSVESFSRSLFVIPGEGVKDATLGEILLVCMLSFRFKVLSFYSLLLVTLLYLKEGS